MEKRFTFKQSHFENWINGQPLIERSDRSLEISVVDVSLYKTFSRTPHIVVTSQKALTHSQLY